jgi:hypothetical protein
MSKAYVEETIRRINELMQRNVTAETYMDLTVEDTKESLFLFRHIEEIAEIVHLYRSGLVPEKEKQHFKFVEDVTAGEIELFGQYMDWFKALDKGEEKGRQKTAVEDSFESILRDFQALVDYLVQHGQKDLILDFDNFVHSLEESMKKGKKRLANVLREAKTDKKPS